MRLFRRNRRAEIEPPAPQRRVIELPPLFTPEDAVDELVRARVVRDRKLSEIAAFRRHELRGIDARFTALRNAVWEEYNDTVEETKTARAERQRAANVRSQEEALRSKLEATL